MLDFAGEDDEEEEDEDHTEGMDERSRQLALKILQKRSQLPADGMCDCSVWVISTDVPLVGLWRSLA